MARRVAAALGWRVVDNELGRRLPPGRRAAADRRRREERVQALRTPGSHPAASAPEISRPRCGRHRAPSLQEAELVASPRPWWRRRRQGSPGARGPCRSGGARSATRQPAREAGRTEALPDSGRSRAARVDCRRPRRLWTSQTAPGPDTTGSTTIALERSGELSRGAEYRRAGLDGATDTIVGKQEGGGGT